MTVSIRRTVLTLGAVGCAVLTPTLARAQGEPVTPPPPLRERSTCAACIVSAARTASSPGAGRGTRARSHDATDRLALSAPDERRGPAG